MKNSSALFPAVALALCVNVANAASDPSLTELEAAKNEAAALAHELGERMEELNQQHRELLGRMQAMEEQRRELELLMSRVDNLGDYRGGTDTAGEVAQVPVVGADQKQEHDAQIEDAPELPRVSSSVGGVLTPKGRLVVEPSLQFLHSSVNRVSVEGFTILPALLIGVIDIVEIDQRSYIGGLTARYGLTDRLEIDMRGSYLFRDESTRTREVLRGQNPESGDLEAVEVTRNADGSDIGDIEMGLRYQFNRGGGKWPFIVGNLRVKSDTGTDPFELATKSALDDSLEFSSELPTGSGFWSVSPSLTFIYPTDPVVFFGNVGYLWTIEDDKGKPTNAEGNVVGFGKVDPGDAWRINVGMGIGLNDQSSLSISYALDLFNRTTIETADPIRISGSDVTVGKLLIGYSLKLPGGSPLNLAIGIGATDDAPDTDLTFRMPFNYFD